MKKNLLLALFILTTTFMFSQNTKKTIKGFIVNSSKEKLNDVNIKSQKSNNSTITNVEGFYKINTKVNDVIVFSKIGYNPVKILITEETEIINISLKLEDEILDEVVVNGAKKKKKLRNLYQIGRGFVDVNSSDYLENKDLNKSAFRLDQALLGKITGFKIMNNKAYIRSYNGPVLWDVNGLLTTTIPTIDPVQVKSVAVLRSLAQLMTYTNTTDCHGAVIVVNTFKDDYQRDISDINSEKNPYTNKDLYSNDAIAYNKIKTGNASYLDTFKNINNSEEALANFKRILPEFKNDKDFYLDIIYHFLENFNKKTTSEAISVAEKHFNNDPQNLKFLSYASDKIGDIESSIRIYKRILALRPSYNQPYRDLANAFLSIKDYKNAWKAYKYYLNKGFKIEEDEIGSVVNTEMINTFINRKKDPNFKEKLYVNNIDNIDTDVRLVFEWNKPEAEFVLEFVNPNNQVIRSKNFSEDIFEQKTKGYNVKEFIIDGDKSDKDWLINLTYLGNKQFKPTFFKVTTFYNWGRKNQSKKVNIFKLNLENKKYQLLKINATSNKHQHLK